MIDSIQLNKLENDLWEAADQLRANSKLTAAEYSMPVLGLIFLRHAYNRFLIVKEKIEPTLPSRGGVKRPLAKNDFLSQKAIFLPEIARFDYLVNLPESKDAGEAINEAMKSIEEEYTNLQGVLPRNFNIFDNDLLRELLRIFNKEALQKADGDLIGKIYEFFLNKFAMSGAQEGGEFFTPTSLVSLIVNVIEPNNGIILDPACGSAGMVVQTGHFIEEEGADPNEKITFYGQEKTDTNTKLAKMNLAVHGLEGDVQEGNSFYEDKHNLIGKCDFVMANPPFNVDEVDKDKDYVKKDVRLPFGLPKNDNANYLWMQYFYSYLNPTGRAGFVMASSASDAGHSEKLIRQKIVETGAVDIMISIGNNFFYTRTLPCTLYFYDRAKETDKKRKDKILMLDARNVYRKVTSKINDFSPEQLKNLTAIIHLYRGNNKYFQNALTTYSKSYTSYTNKLKDKYTPFSKNTNEMLNSIIEHFKNDKKNTVVTELKKEKEIIDKIFNEINVVKTNSDFEPIAQQLKALQKQTEHFTKILVKAKEEIEVKKDSDWNRVIARANLKNIEITKKELVEQVKQVLYYYGHWQWLSVRFPNGNYSNVEGLCKIVDSKDVSGKDYSLTPGRYVGVANAVDEGFDYEARLTEIKIELQDLNIEANNLANVIQVNLEEMGV
jgi:type I restriction enzyme M protein